MSILAKLKVCLSGKVVAEHLRRGKLGERAAKKYLQRQGMKFLTANFRSERGEVDLIFRVDDRPFAGIGILPKLLKMRRLKFMRNDADCLVFVEVKTRSSEEWTRPAAAVNAERRRRLTRTALDYLRLLKNPPVKLRFDIVEVLLRDGAVQEVRHLPNTFAMERPYRYG
ncbi:MAG: YraN family protein [Verrucomicrobia bacterium]|nr:YraN family protein [Verrucomicrobiota bacterium]